MHEERGGNAPKREGTGRRERARMTAAEITILLVSFRLGSSLLHLTQIFPVIWPGFPSWNQPPIRLWQFTVQNAITLKKIPRALQALFLKSWVWSRAWDAQAEVRLINLSPSVQFSSLVMSDSLRPHGLQHDWNWASLSITTPRACSNSSRLSQWCHPTISSSVVPVSSCLQSFPGSGSSLKNQFLSIRWPKDWSFRCSISPSNEYSGLIFFRIDCFDLTVQGTLKSLLQHHSSKASVLRRSDFFMVQLSHPYVTTGKIIALTRWSFVGKVMF